MYKLSTGQLVHRNRARPAHSNDTVADRVEHTAISENMPPGLIFGDRYGNTTILDYDTDPDNDQDDDISDDEHPDDGEELEDDHSLRSFLSVNEGELEDHAEADDADDADEVEHNNEDLEGGSLISDGIDTSSYGNLSHRCN